MSAGAVRRLVEEYAHRHGRPVPPNIGKQLVVAENKETGRSTVISIVPRGEPLNALGTVAAVDKVSFLKRLAPRRSVIGRALIARLADKAHVEICIRGRRDPETGFITEFTFFVPLATWEASGLRQGTQIIVSLRPTTLPTGQTAWFADAIQRTETAR